MLESIEKIGLENILNELEDLDLFSLCDTVTKRLLRSTDRKEATAAILSCTQKPSDLLKRQKITRKVLFNYLHGLNRTVPPECSKVELIMKCLEEWNSDSKKEELTQLMECNEIETELNEYNEMTCMGVEFAKWFFPIYNQLQDFDVKHFWQDVTLKVEMCSPYGNKSLDIASDQEVVRFLAGLIVNEKLFFHPNDSTPECEQEVHGMVKITVSGILHQLSNAVGIFDIIFGLIRNPAFENNWKIKFISLHIKANSLRQSPLPIQNNFSISQSIR